MGGFYRLGIDGAHSVGGGLSAERLRRGFIHSLVPIAMVYVAAHYLTFLLFEGQAIGYLASDPLGARVGPLRHRVRVDRLRLAEPERRLVPAGGVRRARATSPRWCWRTTARSCSTGRPKLAVRSQYWMLGVMVGFTTLALWLLAPGRRELSAAPAAQTAETSSSSATRKEEPQPQAAITFGFSTLKPAPCRLST